MPQNRKPTKLIFLTSKRASIRQVRFVWEIECAETASRRTINEFENGRIREKKHNWSTEVMIRTTIDLTPKRWWFRQAQIYMQIPECPCLGIFKSRRRCANFCGTAARISAHRFDIPTTAVHRTELRWWGIANRLALVNGEVYKNVKSQRTYVHMYYETIFVILRAIDHV